MADDAQDPSLPEKLGGTWSRFLDRWCAGHAPGYERDKAIIALRTVWELLPEAITPERTGLYPVAGLIELGNLLKIVRDVAGFNDLLRRLKLQNQGAHAELIVAGGLIEQRLNTRFGALCEGKLLDIAVEDAVGNIYVEVTSPSKSADLEEQQRITLDLSLQLNQAVQDSSISVEFTDDPTPESIAALLARILSDDSGTWQDVGSSTRFRRWRSSPEARQLDIQYPGVDHRPERIIRSKCEQLSRAAFNVLVIDMSVIGASVPEWLDSIRRLLQPTKNRRLGAVVLFQSLYSVHKDRGYRLWWVVENPHALCRIPERVIQAFRALDESSTAFASGLPTG